MYKPTSSRNDLQSWWSGEPSVEMEEQEIVQKVQVKRNSSMQLPDCPVCWDGFDDGPRMPRLLHCGHTICQVCLEHLLFESGLGQRCVRCPECRGVCVWRGLHELPKNYILLRVLSASSSTYKPTEISPRPIQWPELPLILQISHLSSLIIEHIPGMIERKLWDLGKLLWALTAMLVFLPLSFAHMVLAWTTAVLGSFVFLWFSLGSMGIAVFMFFTWCCYNIAQFLLDLGWGYCNRVRSRAMPLFNPYY
ncbi:hypothetical protein M758_6G164000 [Ceratodon purpureus]|nr:hypothetical protein M758_6G164000 [Ceratodon purpureus]